MWDSTPRKVLVAVETESSDAVLAYAAQEARRRRCGVHLVHVIGPVTGGGRSLDSLVVLNGMLHHRGRTVLAEAAHRLEEMLLDDDELTVSTELGHGLVVPTLVQESAHASLVLLQHRGMGPEGETRTLSVVNGVAARAHAPVVVVPDEWRPPPVGTVPVVSVGVGDLRRAPLIVEAAVGAADRADARVRVVHAWGERGGPDPATHPDEAEQESRRRRDEIAQAFADVLSSHPEVPVEIVVARAPTVEALLDQAVTSTLLVVGRRHPSSPISAHLGPIARVVLRWSSVPVMVVDPVQVGPDGDVLRRDLSTAAIP